jgi:hypothetical protein
LCDYFRLKTGGEGGEAQRFHLHLAALIADKKGQNYRVVINFVRKKLRFSLLRTILESLRGSRSLRHNFLKRAWGMVDVDMDLVDVRNSDDIYIKGG